MQKIFTIYLLTLLSCTTSKNTSVSSVDPFHYTISKNVTARNGAVVSAHALASKAGLQVLQQGGNAVDAAIATQLALAVVYPGAGNLGGGGFMVARLADGKTLALDYRETAPAAATRDMYLDAAGNILPGKSINGHLSVGVPGTIAGLFESMKYAKLSFKQLVQPAIDLAQTGYSITAREANSLNNIQQVLDSFNTMPSAFQKKVRWKEGDTLVQKDLAQTLVRVRDKGLQGFYEGRTAELIVEEMKRGGGILTLQDLKNYKAKWRSPHSFYYKGHTVISMPMPSSGGTLLHQMLKMVEHHPLPSYGFLTPSSVQLMVEAERRAFADRAKHMGDQDFYKVPGQELTDSIYLNKRMSDFVKNKAGNSSDVQPGVFNVKESEQTTHLSVVDKDGNAVSVTTTLNNSYGSKTVVGGAGFFLNDEMDDFSAKPGVPNLYGAVGGEANAIAPGKRMLSSMTPVIVVQNNKPFLIVGTPGGTTIPTSVFQTIVNIIDFKMTTADAVNKPKFHHQWLPDRVDVENDFPSETKTALENMGYKIYVRDKIGRTEVIKVNEDGSFEAVADNRGDDSAEGY
ncbi:MAG TPA: gamma-glutamyltransferase [Chitinophagaceae bacterium]|nr:gamma-glutamyltransferase [Chitinophagaceae bacterium]